MCNSKCNGNNFILQILISLILTVYIFALTGCKTSSSNETEVDLSSFFSEKEGCAVFCKDNHFYVYKKDMINVQESPCSTFKIFLTLAGLKFGVLKDENTMIKWDGIKRDFEFWNKDLTLKEAFSLSAGWWFRKVANDIGKEKLSYLVNELSYGNCDTSGEIPFWVDSSIKISPKEQVEFIKKIFNYELHSFSREHVEILKTAMQKGIINGGKLYGKTGSSSTNKNGWFVGAYEKGGKYLFCAVRLFSGQEISGSTAEKILRNIIEIKYSQI